MAMDDTQKGAAIAMAFAHSQGKDPEGGLPQQGQGTMSFGPGVMDSTGENPTFPGVPPKMGPELPVDDSYRQFRTQQA